MALLILSGIYSSTPPHKKKEDAQMVDNWQYDGIIKKGEKTVLGVSF